MHQTPIVDKLWQSREDSQVVRRAEPEQPRPEIKFEAKRPSESAVAVTYPFSSDPALSDAYSNPWGFVRMGRMIEDLDALAGNIAAAHCGDVGSSGNPLMLVTASIDEIEVRHRANLRDDMELSGRVVWTGRSSLEIDMRVTSTWTADPWLVANFTFVARDQVTQRATGIPPLLPETPEEQEAFERCERKNQERKRLRKLKKESTELSELGFESAQDLQLALSMVKEARPHLDMPALASSQSILMRDTRLENAIICQPQHRNTRGRIFGGFLVRRAFELAFSNCYLFAGSQPRFREVDQVTFLQPVDVGNLLRFESRVLYTSTSKHLKPLVHIGVTAWVTRPEERSSVVSNEFHFKFEKYDGGTVKKVLPATLEEAHSIIKTMRMD